MSDTPQLARRKAEPQSDSEGGALPRRRQAAQGPGSRTGLRKNMCINQNSSDGDFPGGLAPETLPSSTRGVGLNPGQARSHVAYSQTKHKTEAIL